VETIVKTTSDKMPNHILKQDVKFIILHENAKLPQYQSNGSSGLDLCTVENVTIWPGTRKLVSCGLAMELPSNLEGQIRPRSGLAFKHGITVLNTPGTIDSDYRGELKVLLHNAGEQEMTFQPGDRIAQLVIMPIVKINPMLSEDLSETVRGAGGFGSTGVS